MPKEAESKTTNPTQKTATSAPQTLFNTRVLALQNTLAVEIKEIQVKRGKVEELLNENAIHVDRNLIAMNLLDIYEPILQNLYAIFQHLETINKLCNEIGAISPDLPNLPLYKDILQKTKMGATELLITTLRTVTDRKNTNNQQVIFFELLLSQTNKPLYDWYNLYALQTNKALASFTL
jgi:hypothetical protein